MADTTGKQRTKRSHNISVEAESSVREVRKAQQVASESQTPGLLLRAAMEVHSKRAVDAVDKIYYDSASDEELEEERSWAEFGTAQMARLFR